MGRVSRWEYLREIHPRYRKAGRLDKGRMLDEFCRVTRYHRKYAAGDEKSSDRPSPR